jgi:tetratricopeptide (TPR) repeat protein
MTNNNYFENTNNKFNTQIIQQNNNNIMKNQNKLSSKLHLKKRKKINNENQYLNSFPKSQRTFNFKKRKINQQFSKSINLPKPKNNREEIKSNNNFIYTTSSIKTQYKPLFSKTINKSYIFPHIQHIKNKNRYELNKILLKTENLINHKKYILAYNLLKEIISTGEYHSDLFYLFGEVNRILKNYQNAENYLLLALNFEIHSPKVFYSMGLLYHELKQYSYSNIFLKLFIRLINTDNAHYLRAKNYAFMGEYLKAVKEMTIAIDMNEECDYYYKFRSELYNKLGLKEIANEDLNMYNFIKNKNIEENK